MCSKSADPFVSQIGLFPKEDYCWQLKVYLTQIPLIQRLLFSASLLFYFVTTLPVL